MKAIKTIKTIGLLCLAIPLLSSCQIYDIVKDATDQEEGRIVMKDGTEYTGRVRMPKSNTKTVNITTTNGEKLKLKNTDIAVLGVWKKLIQKIATSSYAIHTWQTRCSLQKEEKDRAAVDVC